MRAGLQLATKKRGGGLTDLTRLDPPRITRNLRGPTTGRVGPLARINKK